MDAPMLLVPLLRIQIIMQMRFFTQPVFSVFVVKHLCVLNLNGSITAVGCIEALTKTER